MPLAAHAADAEAPAKKAISEKAREEAHCERRCGKDSGTKDAYKLRGQPPVSSVITAVAVSSCGHKCPVGVTCGAIFREL